MNGINTVGDLGFQLFVSSLIVWFLKVCRRLSSFTENIKDIVFKHLDTFSAMKEGKLLVAFISYFLIHHTLSY